MKKAFLIGLLVLFFSLSLFNFDLVFVDGVGEAGPIVPTCPNGYCTEIDQLKQAINNVRDFITNWIVTPLAVFFLVIGGIVLLTSAGKPEMQSLGKKIIFAAIVGMFLAFGAKAIINFVLDSLGAKTSVPRV